MHILWYFHFILELVTFVYCAHVLLKLFSLVFNDRSLFYLVSTIWTLLDLWATLSSNHWHWFMNLCQMVHYMMSFRVSNLHVLYARCPFVHSCCMIVENVLWVWRIHTQLQYNKEVITNFPTSFRRLIKCRFILGFK